MWERVVFFERVEDEGVLGLSGIVEVYAHEKAVELRFGQWEGSLQLHRILRSNNDKGAWQHNGFALDAYLSLIHCFQESRLCTGCSAVDFVGQHDLCE